MDRLPFRAAHIAAQQLLLFQEVWHDEVGRNFVELVALLAGVEDDDRNYNRLVPIYGRLFRLLAGQHTQSVVVGDKWQNHLLNRILDDSNPFSQQVYRNRNNLSASLQQAASYDLRLLQQLFILTGEFISASIFELKGDLQVEPLPNWYDQALPLALESTARLTLMQKFATGQDWGKLLPTLLDYYAETGVDTLARGRAFRWQRRDANGFFETIYQPDEARLENLVGYEQARAPLLQNTEQFLAGLPANHALLYGARGTGKSSTVKALLTRYGTQGLRLIEVHKNWLGDYPLIVEAVRNRPEKFILFVDDLSFEADEIVYKDLKALLEGSLEARPHNLLIYATSNRRHLVKEQFSDNGRLADAEISAWDTVEEKLSLSDRFGLTITFSPPNQNQYLNIVGALAQQAQLELPAPELERLALQWEMRHSGFSGRLARQFIDHLAGQIQLQKLKV